MKSALTRAQLQDRTTLLNTNKTNLTKSNNNNSNENSFYLVVTHNPKNPPLWDIITDNWPLLSKSKTTCKLEDANLMFGLRCNKNLADFLVRASTKATDNRLTHTTRNPCQCPSKCRYCRIINKTGKMKSHSNDKTFTSMCKLPEFKSNICHHM